MSNSDTDVGSRARSINFNQNEVHLLLDQVDEHKMTILNRSTKRKLKAKAWMQIGKVFKEKKLGPERTEECLRIKWENLKKACSRQSKNEMEITSDEKKSTLNRVQAILGETEKGPVESTQSEDDGT